MLREALEEAKIEVLEVIKLRRALEQAKAEVREVTKLRLALHDAKSEVSLLQTAVKARETMISELRRNAKAAALLAAEATAAAAAATNSPSAVVAAEKSSDGDGPSPRTAAFALHDARTEIALLQSIVKARETTIAELRGKSAKSEVPTLTVPAPAPLPAPLTAPLPAPLPAPSAAPPPAAPVVAAPVAAAPPAPPLSSRNRMRELSQGTPPTKLSARSPTPGSVLVSKFKAPTTGSSQPLADTATSESVPPQPSQADVRPLPPPQAARPAQPPPVFKPISHGRNLLPLRPSDQHEFAERIKEVQGSGGGAAAAKAALLGTTAASPASAEPTETSEGIAARARPVGTWVNAPAPIHGTDARVESWLSAGENLSKMLKERQAKAFLASASSDEQKLSTIEAFVEGGVFSKAQGKKLALACGAAALEKILVEAAFEYESEEGGTSRTAALELHSDGGAMLSVTQEDKGKGAPRLWTYKFKDAADDSDDQTLRLRGSCTSDNAEGEAATFDFELRPVEEGGGWRGLVGGPDARGIGARFEVDFSPV